MVEIAIGDSALFSFVLFAVTTTVLSWLYRLSCEITFENGNRIATHKRLK
jgi:hypothetical protein